jgi:hypothetical protein
MNRDFEAISAFTDQVSGSHLRVGDTISMDAGRGGNLCRKGLLKDVSLAPVTEMTRIEDLEEIAVDHEDRIGVLETTLGI